MDIVAHQFKASTNAYKKVKCAAIEALNSVIKRKTWQSNFLIGSLNTVHAMKRAIANERWKAFITHKKS